MSRADARAELRAIQRAVGGDLIPEVRAAQPTSVPPEDALPVALELFYTAFAMKPASRSAGLLIASRYAAITGLEPDQVEALALASIREAVDRHRG